MSTFAEKNILLNEVTYGMLKVNEMKGTNIPRYKDTFIHVLILFSINENSDFSLKHFK